MEDKRREGQIREEKRKCREWQRREDQTRSYQRIAANIEEIREDQRS